MLFTEKTPLPGSDNMVPKKRQTKQEEKIAAIDYLKKAQDSHEAMLLAFKNENFNAVGTLAIQCAISSADAICVNEKGLRSISQDHGDIWIWSVLSDEIVFVDQFSLSLF